MPLPPRLFPTDVEHGKKDDDHKPRTKGIGWTWQSRKPTQKKTWHRIALGLLAMIGLYYFFKNMPTDLENPRRRPSYTHSAAPDAPVSRPPAAASRPPHVQEDTATMGSRDFNGPIKFFNLAQTLHAVEKTKGYDLVNQNVLFAAASLKSAAILLPIACEMGIRERNFVHFAFMGRDEISIETLQSVNGITKECRIYFHDARPDFGATSSDSRMGFSAASGLRHCNTFIHPQATFVDASGEEEVWLLKGIEEMAEVLERTVIKLPANVESNMMWITLLDSVALSAWNKVSIDIMVHAQPSASGSLIRLLQSLEKADFFSSAPPRLTIELPNDVDEPTKQYLSSFSWPPKSYRDFGDLLILHHRIPQTDVSAGENSIRMLESFWPADPSHSHVLILSPQVELSPLFYHYLKYAVLVYKYSASKAVAQHSLLSISLDLPSTYLNDTTPFSPPLQKQTSALTPFLWQAPSSNAALYFGDKWVEMHSFITKLLVSQHTLPKPETLHLKEVSKTYPSWLEHVLKLARARGYWTVYPTFENKETVATLHNDLYRLPEEFAKELEATTPDMGELTADPAQHLSLQHAEKPLVHTPLMSILPNGGDLPFVYEMPLLTWDGDVIEANDIYKSATAFAERFSREIGGCEQPAAGRQRLDMDASDLFCF